MGQYFEWVNYGKREIMMTDPLPDGQKHQFRYAVNEGRTTPETSSSRVQRAVTDALMQTAAGSLSRRESRHVLPFMRLIIKPPQWGVSNDVGRCVSLLVDL